MIWSSRWGRLCARGIVATLVALGLSSSALAMGGGGGNNTTITAPSTADFGRVLLNQTPSEQVTLSKVGEDTTTYTAVVTPVNTGATVNADGGIGSGSGSGSGGLEVIVFNLQNNANGSASTGLKSYTVVIDNTAADSGGAGQGSADLNDPINVTATVVANRDLSAGTANLGRAMLSTALPSVSTTVSGGASDDNNATRVNLNNGSASSGGVTVTRTSGTFNFNAASQTATVGVASTGFASTGLKSGSVNVATLLSNGETAITGTPTVDTSVLVGYTASIVNNRDLTGGPTAALGRVMINASSPTVNTTVLGGSADGSGDGSGS